ncbi:DDE-type integrase/transposase/recombinase [Ruficoccus amylovorans]
MADRTAKGGSIRMLTILDEYTRECLCIHVDRHLNAAKVRAVMSELISAYGSPEHIRSDNGSEFIEKSLRTGMPTRASRRSTSSPASATSRLTTASSAASAREPRWLRHQPHPRIRRLEPQTVVKHPLAYPHPMGGPPVPRHQPTPQNQKRRLREAFSGTTI